MVAPANVVGVAPAYAKDAAGNWYQIGAPWNSLPLDGLTDVDTSTVAPADGQVLQYDLAAGQWVPGDAAAGGAVAAIDDLTDVDTSTSPPVAWGPLVWNPAGNWVPAGPVWMQWYGTQAEYDALPAHDPATLYIITA